MLSYLFIGAKGSDASGLIYEAILLSLGYENSVSTRCHRLQAGRKKPAPGAAGYK